MAPRGASGGKMPRNMMLALAPLIFLLIALLPGIVRNLATAVRVVGSPTGVDYGEGIVWQQMINIVRGQGYGPVEGIPALVYHYPPVYYLVTAAVEPLVRDGLQAGRLVCFLSTLATTVLVGIITYRLCGARNKQFARILCAALAALMFLHYKPVIFWGALMRVDPLAVFFTMSGVLCVIEALRRPRLIYASALFFTLAVYTKQTQALAPAGIYGALLFMRPRLALRGIVTTAVLGLAVLGLMTIVTDGRFFHHVVAANVNRFRIGVLFHNLKYMIALDLISLLFAGTTACLLLVRLLDLRKRDVEEDEASAALVSFLGFTAGMTASLLMLGKSGSSTNYWLGWLPAVAVLIGLGLFQCVHYLRAALDGSGRPWWGLLLGVPVLLALFPLLIALHVDQSSSGDGDAVEEQLIAVARECRGWVISDDMVAILRAGKPVVWEPAIFAELGALGRYNEKPVIEAVRSHRVCAVILEDDLKTERFNPSVLAAIENSYVHKEKVGRFLVFR